MYTFPQQQSISNHQEILYIYGKTKYLNIIQSEESTVEVTLCAVPFCACLIMLHFSTHRLPMNMTCCSQNVLV